MERSALLIGRLDLAAGEALADGTLRPGTARGSRVAVVAFLVFAVRGIPVGFVDGAGVTVVAVHVLPAFPFQSGGAAALAGFLGCNFRILSHGASLL
jgi:hypothetical protein